MTDDDDKTEPNGDMAAQSPRQRSGVLQLSPDSVKLRQVARSWSEGHVSQEDYRAIRTATIESMLGAEGDAAADDEDMEREPTLSGPLPGGDDLVATESPGRVMVVLGIAALLLLAGTAALLTML